MSGRLHAARAAVWSSLGVVCAAVGGLLVHSVSAVGAVLLAGTLVAAVMAGVELGRSRNE